MSFLSSCAACGEPVPVGRSICRRGVGCQTHLNTCKACGEPVPVGLSTCRRGVGCQSQLNTCKVGRGRK